MLFEKLSRKTNAARGHRVGPGWIKYHHGGSYWNLDDGNCNHPLCTSLTLMPVDPYLESDYSIFVWRHKSDVLGDQPEVTIHMQAPDTPLPEPPQYQNPKFYAFIPSEPTRHSYAKSLRSIRSRRSTKSLPDVPYNEPSGVAKFKAEFHRFHSENGVRTVRGKIGPVDDGACDHRP